jgi:hypothetical protein
MSKTQKKKQAQAAAALAQNQNISDDAMPQMPISPDPRSEYLELSVLTTFRIKYLWSGDPGNHLVF